MFYTLFGIYIFSQTDTIVIGLSTMELQDNELPKSVTGFYSEKKLTLYDAKKYIYIYENDSIQFLTIKGKQNNTPSSSAYYPDVLHIYNQHNLIYKKVFITNQHIYEKKLKPKLKNSIYIYMHGRSFRQTFYALSRNEIVMALAIKKQKKNLPKYIIGILDSNFKVKRYISHTEHIFKDDKINYLIDPFLFTVDSKSENIYYSSSSDHNIYLYDYNLSLKKTASSNAVHMTDSNITIQQPPNYKDTTVNTLLLESNYYFMLFVTDDYLLRFYYSALKDTTHNPPLPINYIPDQKSGKYYCEENSVKENNQIKMLINRPIHMQIFRKTDLVLVNDIPINFNPRRILGYEKNTLILHKKYDYKTQIYIYSRINLDYIESKFPD